MTWFTVSIFSLTLLIGIVSAAKHPRIVGGADTKIQFYPYHVSIRFLGKHFCSGSIISDRHILTAAHCVDPQSVDKNDLTVHAGTSRSDKSGRNVYKVLSVDVHSEWDNNKEKGYPNNIAVLTVKTPIVFNDYQNKVNLPNDDAKDFKKVYQTGWGSTTNIHNKKPTFLQELQVKVLTSNKCQPLIAHKISNKQICAFRSIGVGACLGDDGGPLVSNRQLIGIFSFIDGKTCGDGTPDVYTNVFAYKDFIAHVMDK